jgi:hypothetical protein
LNLCSIKIEFKKRYGIDLGTFLELSLILLIEFSNKFENDLNNNSVSILEIFKYYDKQYIDSFIYLISKPLPEIRKLLSTPKNRTHFPSEYYEMTPLVKFPLIRSGSIITCLHPKLLFRYLEHFIYNQIKAWENSQKEYQKLTKIFEKYIGETLEYYSQNFLTEKEIEMKYGKEGKQIDYIINEPNANIFLDAKSVEMDSIGHTSSSLDTIANKTKSLSTAIEQAFSVLEKIKQKPHSEINPKKKNFLLVVTMKEFNISNGDKLYKLAQKNIDRIIDKYTELIPLQNIYFITIDEFDGLCDLIYQTNQTFEHYLSSAIEEDQAPETRSMFFGMKLEIWRRSLQGILLVKERLEEIINSIDISTTQN